MMTRNTEHRVEIAFPVLDPTCRDLVKEYMAAQLRDNVKARQLTSDGTWARIERSAGEEPFNSQEFLLARAYRQAGDAAVASIGHRRIHKVASPVPAEAFKDDDTPATSPEHTRKPEADQVDEPAAASQPATNMPAEIPVKAQIIEPEPEPEPAPAPHVATHAQPAAQTAPKHAATPAGDRERKHHAIAKRQPGRLRLGLGLIGLGLKTLVTGKTK